MFKIAEKSYNLVFVEDNFRCVEVVKILESLDKTKVYGLDIETSRLCPVPANERVPQPGLDPRLSRIRLLQVYDGDKTVYIFDLFKIDPLLLLNFLKSFRFVAHHAMFERLHLFNLYSMDFNIVCSQLTAQQIHHAEEKLVQPDEDEDDYAPKTFQGYSLRAQVLKYLGVELDKAEQNTGWDQEVLSQEQIVYAAKDAVLTHDLFQIVYSLIHKYGMLKSWSCSNAAQSAVREMRWEGMRIDLDKHKNLIVKWEQELSELKTDLDKHFFGVNLNSPVQISNWLTKFASEELLQVFPRNPPSKRYPEGSYSFSSKKLVPFREIPQFDCLIKFKKVNKCLSSFGESLLDFIHPVTGKIHPNYSEVSTGRYSASNPNIQQSISSKEFREIFIPDDGDVFIIADYSQIEMKIISELSGDQGLKKVYDEGLDVYTFMASRLYGKPYESIEKKSMERKISKACCLALGYGMGANKLKDTLTSQPPYIQCSLEQAKEYWNGYHYKMMPQYSRWCDRQRDLCTSRGYALTALGGRKSFAEKDIYTGAVNFTIQGTAAHVLKAAKVYLKKDLGEDGKVVASIHDELILSCREENAEHCKKLLEYSMLRGWLYVFPNGNTRNVADAEICNSWADGKEW